MSDHATPTLEDRLFTDRAPAIFATAREAAARIAALEAVIRGDGNHYWGYRWFSE